jgi:peroxin-16
MLWYLLRGSIWETYTRFVQRLILSELILADGFVNRPKLESFVTQTARTPLLSLFGSFAKDWIPLINEYYYCASCSTMIISQI